MDGRTSNDSSSLPRRLGWLVLIWACSVAVLGVAALAMRILMRMAGLST